MTDCQRELADSRWSIFELSVICWEELLLKNSRLILGKVAITFFDTSFGYTSFRENLCPVQFLGKYFAVNPSGKVCVEIKYSYSAAILAWFTLPNAGNPAPFIFLTNSELAKTKCHLLFVSLFSQG